ncbi:MAG: non-reducing end alpha-L-arabinofuranosidase family hydrolase [Cyclobacteriaceae bacterium]
MKILKYSFTALLFLHLAFACNSPSSEVKKTESAEQPPKTLSSNFTWTTGAPIIDTDQFGEDEWIAIKDPSIVRYDDRYHLFCTLRGHERSHAIVYTSFTDFDQARETKPVVLPNHAGYHCAPQVFYFTPHKKWYLICQAKDSNWTPEYQAAFATSDDISDPNSWSALTPMGVQRPEDDTFLDFWAMREDSTMHMFFTSDNVNMWREETSVTDFPFDWSEPELAFRGDIFEASHIYRLTDTDSTLYLNLIEARLSEDRRYFKAYTASRLDGEWQPLAADSAQAYAAMNNVQQADSEWTNSISHGELIRAGYDEYLEAQSDAPFIFQGVLHQDRQGKPYGQIPWDLGLLEPRE